MFRAILLHVRGNVVAYFALFFALTGGAVAANNYLRSTDTIAEGDLAGSTYGNPLIGGGKVTNAKLANSALTVSSGTGLTGGGSVSLGGSTTVGVANGGINTTQLHDGSVTTSKFDSGAKAPDAAKLDGANPSDYGAVLSGRINGGCSAAVSSTCQDYGAASGTSTASDTEAAVSTLSPNRPLKVRDLSVRATTASGVGVRTITLRANGTDVLSCQTPQGDMVCTANGPADIPANSTLDISDFAQSFGIFPVPAADVRFAFRLTGS